MTDFAYPQQPYRGLGIEPLSKCQYVSKSDTPTLSSIFNTLADRRSAARPFVEALIDDHIANSLGMAATPLTEKEIDKLNEKISELMFVGVEEEATSKLQDEMQESECKHGKSIFDSSHTCDDEVLEKCNYCETGTEPLGRLAAKEAIDKVIRDIPKYPIKVTWLPIDQIGEVFPDWRIGGKEFIVQDDTEGKLYAGNYKDNHWRCSWFWGHVTITPTHFSHVVFGDE